MEIVYIIGALLVIGVIYTILDNRRMSRIAGERGALDICSFARSFDYRKIDTKIIREVWNEVQDSLGEYNGKKFPVLADDLFEETYKLDPEDLDDAYWAIADKLGISTDSPEKNPYWGNVKSVSDLVQFLHHQPKVKNA
jgi:hypothetical protein